ncbi:unnamed protein product [Mucor hiemalis]
MYYFNSNNSTTYGSEQGNDNNGNNHNRPLFSQPYNPFSVNGTPTDFSQEMDFNSYDPSNALFNEALFDTSQVHNWDHFDSIDPQEAILLSDPNFLRQHQLLQDQQREMHSRLIHDEDDQKQVSNLTAMFDHSVKQEPHHDKEEVTVRTEPQDVAVVEEEERRQKKGNNRKQHVMVKEEPNKIDHQRRFNELQARFRVNYARKPTQQTVKSSNINTTSSSSLNTTTTTNNTVTTNTATNTNHTNNTIHNAKSKSISPQPQPSASFEESVSMPTTTPPPPPQTTVAPVAIGGLVMNNEETELSSSFPSRTMPIQIQRVSRNNGSQPFDADSHQKQLDSQLDKVDFEDITVSELKEMLRQRGKPATGKKAVLLQRLQEERDLARGGRSAGSYGRVASNRHSQPLPFSRSVNEAPQRPRSFQGTSPVMIQQSSAVVGSYTAGVSPSSPGGFLPGSPSGSLHRSIANMHIGSPPAISRRYSPYSPRLSSSPKPTHQEYYSSSVPLNNTASLSSSPVNNPPSMPPANNADNNMMLSLSYSAARPGRYYNNPKTYKPFTSSALATPDREEDVNPFDAYYGGGGDPPIKEEDNTMEGHSDGMMNGNNYNNMDWLDMNAFDMLLQQQQGMISFFFFFFYVMFPLT